jgi:hypothetical protein
MNYELIDLYSDLCFINATDEHGEVFSIELTDKQGLFVCHQAKVRVHHVSAEDGTMTEINPLPAWYNQNEIDEVIWND